MITEPAATRNYTMSDADLAMFASNLVNLMNRDSIGFIGFGITSLAIDSFETLENSFEVYPSDEMLQADVMIATEAKDAIRDQVLISCRSISLRAKNKWGEGSPQYRKFAVTGINNLNDRELLFQARRVHLVGTGFLSSLASEGLTTPILNDFEDLNESFELALNEQINKINARDIAKRERINLGNDVFGAIRKYCDIGKQIWASVDESKYNDYLQDKGGPSGLPGKIQSLAYNSATAKFTWQADSNATSYQIETSPDGSEWLQIYEGASAEYINIQGPGTGIARCRGVNDTGSGSWSDNLDYTVPVPVPHLVSIGFDGGNNRSIVTFDTVAYADVYLIYQSIVTIGSPAGAFDEIGTPTSSPFNTVSANNAMREYYYVVASYNDILSEHSNTMFLDVPIA